MKFIDASAERAIQDIKALAEHHRRSLGQIVRWQQHHVSQFSEKEALE